MVATVLLAMFIHNVAVNITYKRKCSQVKQNLHAIQLAVERYSVDDPQGTYPRSIKDVIRRGYLAEFPINPFTGMPMRCVEEKTDAVKFSMEYVPPEAEPGDFMYFKRFGPNGQQSLDQAPQGYSLAAYF